MKKEQPLRYFHEYSDYYFMDDIAFFLIDQHVIMVL